MTFTFDDDMIDTAYFQYNGPRYNHNIISKSHIPEPDICPKCIKELDEWWKRGKT